MLEQLIQKHGLEKAFDGALFLDYSKWYGESPDVVEAVLERATAIKRIKTPIKEGSLQPFSEI